ncbi:MAG: hypothetical protein J3K34DRAFT_44722 [Monoraphidium minutum]|nr:MAG: hypothetical protein J3K34DRAFT_44722 [Monoraphidium minutum]
MAADGGDAPFAAAAAPPEPLHAADWDAKFAHLPHRSHQDSLVYLCSRHRDNAAALLHAALLRGDYATAAGAAAALLRADSFAAETNPRVALGTGAARRAARTADVVWAVLELLRRHAAPPEQLRRFLRKAVHLFGTRPAYRSAALAELAVVLWQQGDVPQAYDVLSSAAAAAAPGQPGAAAAEARGGAAQRFQAAALMGVLRHRQW